MTPNQLLLHLSIINDGNYDKMINALQNKNYPVNDDELKTTTESYVTLMDEEYPSLLKNTGCKAPIVLYYKGNTELLNNKKVALGYSRKSQDFNLAILNNLLKEDEGLTYVVGGSLRNDFIERLTQTKRVILVLPCGIENYYQDIVDNVINNGGLVISEYPKGVAISQEHFIAKDRIIAGLCDKLLVLSCSKRGGTNILVAMALQENKDIFVIPTDITSDLNNNDLIYEGATIVVANHLIDDMI